MKKYIFALLLVSSLLATTAFALSNWDILAGSGIIVKQETEEWYRLNDLILRQEVVWMAIKVNWQTLPENYSCRWFYQDLTSTRPNNWACRAVEIASDIWLVSRENTTFRPEDRITKAEALAMLMNAAKMNTGAVSTTTSFTDVTIPWQVNITDKALKLGVIDWGATFSPNKDATRWEVFEMAVRIIKPNAESGPTEWEFDFQDILDILEGL
ncbi:MAG: hypothetical protein ACD_3C00192G0014 [uncultured bacterium (gcode 4)]|uniref:SLH domain-containing protein n=2 Tax=uncultured bacterium (gcode 4) TaxID=1234023 RepID=K2GBK5_9BACT|nr:MAG: hypothetical protein ACD_3C00192G0014 [uncultured bacterium (gcode 4)]